MKKFLLCILLFGVPFVCNISGQHASDISLEGVEITSHHTFSDIIPMQTLVGEQLERLNALNIADALRYFSGLQVKDYGGVGGIKTVNIRSMGSQHLGVYYDGIELGNAQNGQIDLGQFSLDNVESVSLYNGQKSSLMQTASDYGNAGSVYINTRVPRFRSGEKYHFKGRIKYGISNMLQLSALYESKLSDKISLSANLGTLTSDGKYEFRYRKFNTNGTVAYDTTAVRENGDVQAVRFEANVHGLIQNGMWKIKAYTYHSNRGIPGAIVNNVWRREERQTDGNSFLQATYSKDVTDRYTFRVLGKYAYYYTHYQNRDTTTFMVDNMYKQQEAYVSTTHCLQLLPWLSASVAYDLRWAGLTSDMYTCPEPHRWSHLVSIAMAVSMKKFGAQASILYNNTHNDGKKSAGGVSPVGANMRISRFTPALFFNYFLLENRSLSIRGYMKNSFRMPTFNDLYYADIGNSNLKPESATQYDIGVTFQPILKSAFSVRFQSDTYFNRVKNKIVAYPKGQQFRWTMLNLGEVHITGVDVEGNVSYKFRKNTSVNLRLQYTYQKSIDVTNTKDSYYRHQIPYIPKHSGSAILSAILGNFAMNYSFIYTGERYSQHENIAYNKLEPWYTSDASLTYKLTMRKMDIKATLEVNNIFSQDYEVILNYPMPGRNAAFSVEVVF